ncbi:MAG: phosphoribosylformylglycinamidine synthase subunit PurQ [Planctomycetes bacterium]|nr:phosphoribosylformylglycinamidine synthase subunit PurQ [Planctomycetota bacterium]
MSAPKILVLRAPGINCERETLHALQRAGGAPEFVHIQQLLAEPQRLEQFSALAVPGGFAYGDDISSGRVLAQEMKHRLGDRLLRFVDRGGLVLGICNGFQVLVRLGLLPCTQHRLEEEVTLTHNLSNHYECRWVTLKTQKSRCVFLPPGLTLRWPAAHGEGRLCAKTPALQRLLLDEGYAALLYVDGNGQATERYPQNPNGAPLGMAGLTNASGRVLGMMPHPDRSYLPTHMPNWRRTLLEQGALPEDGDGMVVFRELVRVAKAEA